MKIKKKLIMNIKSKPFIHNFYVNNKVILKLCSDLCKYAFFFIFFKTNRTIRNLKEFYLGHNNNNIKIWIISSVANFEKELCSKILNILIKSNGVKFSTFK